VRERNEHSGKLADRLDCEPAARLGVTPLFGGLTAYILLVPNITAQGCGWKTPKSGLSSGPNSILDTDIQPSSDFQSKIDANPLDSFPFLLKSACCRPADDRSLRRAKLA
jgi:hypothetical protein